MALHIKSVTFQIFYFNFLIPCFIFFFTIKIFLLKAFDLFLMTLFKVKLFRFFTQNFFKNIWLKEFTKYFFVCILYTTISYIWAGASNCLVILGSPYQSSVITAFNALWVKAYMYTATCLNVSKHTHTYMLSYQYIYIALQNPYIHVIQYYY